MFVRVLRGVVQIVSAILAMFAVVALALYVASKGTPNYQAGAIAFGLAFYFSSITVLLEPEGQRKTPAKWMAGLSVITLVLSAIIVPVFQGAQHAASGTSCLSNVKTLAVSAITYGVDYDDRFPPAGEWFDILTPMSSEGDKCPDAKSPYSYAMNSSMSTVNLEDVEEPANTVLIFEADAYAPNASGGKEWFSPRHFGRGNVALTDGHAKLANAEMFNRYRWAK